MDTHTIEPLESRRLLSAVAFVESGTAIVRGNVFRDANRNGVRESAEVGQPNIRVYLDYNNNGTRDGDAEPISITNSTGGYRFENAIAPETIPVRLLLAGTNFVQTRPSDNAARVVRTTVGGNIEVESFGVAEPVVPPPAVTILTGIVYTDRNRNGTREAGEPGRANVAVYIDANNDGARQEGERLTRTNIEGRYYFERVDAGEKTLRLLLTGTNLQQTQPAENAPVTVNVVANKTTQASPFGVAEIIVIPPPATTGTIRGRVFNDADRDGNLDTGERGVPNRVVYLDLDSSGTRTEGDRTALTNGEGRYAFERVLPGTYDVRLVLGNLFQTRPANNAGYTVTVVAGATVADLHFGVYRVERTLLAGGGTDVTPVLIDKDLVGRVAEGLV